MLEVFGFPNSYPKGHKNAGDPFKGNFLFVNPHDKYGEKIKLSQYGLARKNRIIDAASRDPRIRYGISTLPGQSGSPLVIDNTIIGIHEGGEIGKEFNVGRKID